MFVVQELPQYYLLKFYNHLYNINLHKPVNVPKAHSFG